MPSTMSKVISSLIRNIFNPLAALKCQRLINGARVSIPTICNISYVENPCQFGGKLRNKLSTIRKTKKFTAPDEGYGSL